MQTHTHTKNQIRLISLCFDPQARFQQHNRWTDSFSLSHCWTGPFAGRKCCSGDGSLNFIDCTVNMDLGCKDVQQGQTKHD